MLVGIPEYHGTRIRTGDFEVTVAQNDRNPVISAVTCVCSGRVYRKLSVPDIEVVTRHVRVGVVRASERRNLVYIEVARFV